MSETIRVIVNGEPAEVPAEASVTTLLAERDLADRPVAVEVNGSLVPKRQHAEHRLASGDAIEIVTLVGGG